jgi:uncharacterized iron-regulated membrane protein
MPLRSVLFWPHLIAGLTAGLVILVMSVTGVLLTYERQLIAWADSGYRSELPAQGAPRLPVDRLIERVRAARPDVSPASVTVGSAPDAPVVVAFEQRSLFADAYTGRILGEGGTKVRAFMSGLRSWHRWLAAEGEQRAVARAVTGWANLIFALLALSGLYLWFPRKWTWAHIRSIVFFSRKATGMARDFNWHNVIGFWSALPLVIVVVSAIPISFPWANNAVYRAVGEEPPAGRGGGAGGRGGREGGARGTAPGEPSRRTADGTRERPVNGLALHDLMARAERHANGWRTITLRLPASQNAPVVFAIDRGDGGQPHLRSTLTLDRATGAVVSDESFASQTLGRRIRSVMRFAHTGEVLGLPGQTVAGIVSAGAVVLVWTGFALAWRRFRAWLSRRSREQESVSASASPAA